MPTYQKQALSGSTDGRPIPITVTTPGGTGTLIHTATSASAENEYDEIWVWATNIDETAVELGVEFGGVADGDHIHINVPGLGAGPLLVIPGIPLQNGLVCRATASVASDVNVFGYINRVIT